MPEDRTTHVSSVCSWQPRPLLVTGMLLLALRDHFSRSDSLEHSEFRNRPYKTGAEATQTGLIIEPVTKWKPELSGKRPAVLVKRNQWTNIKLGIQDNQSWITDQGLTEHTKGWYGSHTVLCLSHADDEAEILGAEVYRFLMHFGPLLRPLLYLAWFELKDVGAIQPFAEATTSWVVPVTVVYGWFDAWLLRPHSPKILSVGLDQVIDLGS